jgi:proprotein convertase subtilisin/kexin type 5
MFYGRLAGEDEAVITIDGVFIDKIIPNSSSLIKPICSSDPIFDFMVVYYKNITNHVAPTLTLEITTNTPFDFTLLTGLSIKNVQVFVDTCDDSCLTCSGPAKVTNKIHYQIIYVQHALG